MANFKATNAIECFVYKGSTNYFMIKRTKIPFGYFSTNRNYCFTGIHLKKENFQGQIPLLIHRGPDLLIWGWVAQRWKPRAVSRVLTLARPILVQHESKCSECARQARRSGERVLSLSHPKLLQRESKWDQLAKRHMSKRKHRQKDDLSFLI